MKQMVGLKNYGSRMIRYEYGIPFGWILESDWDFAHLVAPADLPSEYNSLIDAGINYHCYDIDPKYKSYPKYTICDPIFDPVELGQTIVNFNAHKMYPIGKVHKGEFIIVGSDDEHNGNCNIIRSCDQLIEQNLLHTVFKKEIFRTNRCNYYFVWGNND